MRKLLVPLILAITVAVVFGCSSNNQAREFDALITQAKGHYDSIDIVSAREVYIKALEIKEDTATRSRLRELESEIEKTREFSALIEKLREAQRGAKAALHTSDMRKQGELVDDVIMAIDNFEYTGEYHVNKYAQQARNGSEYIPLGVAGLYAKSPEAYANFDMGKAREDLVSKIDKFIESLNYPDTMRSIK